MAKGRDREPNRPFADALKSVRAEKPQPEPPKPAAPAAEPDWRAEAMRGEVRKGDAPRAKKAAAKKEPEPAGATWKPFAGLALPVTAKKREAPPPPAKVEAPADADDAALFREHVAGVKPLAKKHRQRVTPPKAPPPSAPLYDEDAEALAKLAAMVDGEEPLGHEFSEEHTEWIAEDADPSILVRLREGAYSPQAHLDFHGMTREAAKQAVFRFLADAKVKRMRCVLLVHGRGHHSEDAVPVIKLALQRWLRRGALKSWVFAWCSARPVDGGAGAMYVLLRS